MPKLEKGQAKVLTLAEYKRLLSIISTTKYAKRDKLAFLLSCRLGMRAIEIAALKISQVITPDGNIVDSIQLVITKSRKKDGETIRKTRNLPLPDLKKDNQMHLAIADYIEERKQDCEKRKTYFCHDAPLILSKRGDAFTNKTLQMSFHKLYRLAGIHNGSSHSGRRTFATRLIERGVDIKAISTLMGHASIAMTATYIENNPARLKKIITHGLY